MGQALHRDMPVSCTCRVGTVHALLDLPKDDLATAAGLSARSVGSLWRVPPLDEEDFFRAFMRDSPLREAVEDFLYQRRKNRVSEALQAEAKREPSRSPWCSRQQRRSRHGRSTSTMRLCTTPCMHGLRSEVSR